MKINSNNKIFPIILVAIVFIAAGLIANKFKVNNKNVIFHAEGYRCELIIYTNNNGFNYKYYDYNGGREYGNVASENVTNCIKGFLAVNTNTKIKINLIK